MSRTEHTFHIPVMGTGFSADTPIRVAHFGISSVVSIVDDLLLERLREYYHRLHDIPYTAIKRFDEDGRARRITAYLNMVHDLVHKKMEEIRHLPFGEANEKTKYFELLPEESPLKKKYRQFVENRARERRSELEQELTDHMKPGSIDVNIMTKLDRLNVARNGEPLPPEYSDARAALRGYANSKLESAVVFSAGLNQGLFNYMTQFSDFYHNEVGEIKKRIILKVSDFRSAMIQGKILAKKGLEVHEYRIESGLNCGGHAFASNGFLLPSILKEFKEKREQLAKECRPYVEQFYRSIGKPLPEANPVPLVTVQGGIGTHGEDVRLRTEYGVDRTGWASPFMLVPEATLVDDSTRELLKNAKVEDCYTSNASPLGVKFNTVRGAGSLVWTKKQAETDRPGSPCPKGFLVSNTDFSEKPLCTASQQYLKMKVAALRTKFGAGSPQEERALERICLCEHLGNSALIAVGAEKEEDAPQAVCPGPNIGWFDRFYSLREMIDHIYGRGKSLVPEHRPHMFAKELEMYGDHFEQRINDFAGDAKELKELEEFKQNLDMGMDYCLEIADGPSHGDENLASIKSAVAVQRIRVEELLQELRDRFASFSRELQPVPLGA